jgi:hypothetical protein
VLCLDKFYNGKEALGLDDFMAVNTWLQRCLDRPASKVGFFCPAGNFWHTFWHAALL